MAGKPTKCNKKKLCVSLLLVVVAAGGYTLLGGYFSPEERAIKLEVKEAAGHQARATQLVKQYLTDPESAIFEHVRYVVSTGVICGSVNAKNRMGGYVGMTVFIVGVEGDVTFEATGASKYAPMEERIKAMEEYINFHEKMKSCFDAGDGA